MIFLCETLVNSRRIEEIKNLISFNSCLAVDVNGKSEGLALFWKHPFQCHLLNSSPNFISVEVQKNGFPSKKMALRSSLAAKNKADTDQVDLYVDIKHTDQLDP